MKENEERLRQQPGSLALLVTTWLTCGAISGLQVIDCYPCPMVGIGKSKPGFVNGFWVWGPG
jgi:hypothetical protein